MYVRSLIKSHVRVLVYTLKTFFHKDKYIVLKATVKIFKGKMEHYNWGDDMNCYMVKMLSGKDVLLLPPPESKLLHFFPLESYLAIGSTVTIFSLDHTTVWGAGIINSNKIHQIKGKPSRICAVRGPLTRKVLIEKGYDCPEVYGDPILLLSRFYQPKEREIKHEIGVIPHYIDKSQSIIRELRTLGVKIIDVQEYNHWSDFVDEICSCKYILSSSLHGLIVAESYSVPSVWVGFSEYIDGWEFKFHDYYLSIHKAGAEMLPLTKAEDVFSEFVTNQFLRWQKGEIDLDLLLSACPFYNNPNSK